MTWFSHFTVLLRLLAGKMLDLQQPILANVGDLISPRCRLHTARYMNALKDFQMWAVQSEYSMAGTKRDD